jgi:hypothetical protein
MPKRAEELITGEVCLFDTFGSEFVHYLCFSGDRSVVGTGHPAGILAFHARTANQGYLE